MPSTPSAGRSIVRIRGNPEKSPGTGKTRRPPDPGRQGVTNFEESLRAGNERLKGTPKTTFAPLLSTASCGFASARTAPLCALFARSEGARVPGIDVTPNRPFSRALRSTPKHPRSASPAKRLNSARPMSAILEGASIHPETPTVEDAQRGAKSDVVPNRPLLGALRSTRKHPRSRMLDAGLK